MLRVALDYAAKNNAKRITQFNVEISAAADESEDSLVFHIQNLAQGTLAEGARIEVSRVPLKAKCLDCGNEFELTENLSTCPRCSSGRIHPQLIGDDFKLASIEVE